MDKLFTILVSALAAFIGMWYFENKKRKSAEALNDNSDVINELNKKNAEIFKNSELIKIEEEKRKELNDQMEKDKKSSNILDFFNRKK